MPDGTTCLVVELSAGSKGDACRQRFCDHREGTFVSLQVTLQLHQPGGEVREFNLHSYYVCSKTSLYMK